MVRKKKKSKVKGIRKAVNQLSSAFSMDSKKGKRMRTLFIPGTKK